jgi:hypothetical protein
MAVQRIGYVRVSTLDQNDKRQLEGPVLDRVFTDKASDRDTTRPELTGIVVVRPRWGHRGCAQHGPARPQPRRPACSGPGPATQGGAGGVRQGELGLWSPTEIVRFWLDGIGAVNLSTGKAGAVVDAVQLEAAKCMVNEQYNGLSTGNGKAAVIQLLRTFTNDGYPLDNRQWLQEGTSGMPSQSLRSSPR